MADFAYEVAEAFHTFDGEEMRQCLRADIANLGAEEASRQFARAETILEGFLKSFQDDVALFMVLCEAKCIATEARRRAEDYAAANA